jgi:hypothetical protein
MSLVSRVLVDDAVELIVGLLPPKKRLLLRQVSRQFNAVVKKHISRSRAHIHVRHPSDIRDGATITAPSDFGAIINSLFPLGSTNQWIWNAEISFPHGLNHNYPGVGAHLGHLEHLKLYDSKLYDAFFLHMTSLQSLDFYDARSVTNASLSRLTSLRSLCIGESSHINDHALSCLPSLTSLSMINCHGVTGKCFTRLQHLESLLIIHNANLALHRLSALQSLRSLKARRTHLLGDELRELTALTDLDVEECRNFRDSTLLRLTSLRRLQVTNIDITVPTLAAPAFANIAASLTYLDVSENSMSVDDAFLSIFSALQTLKARKCRSLRRPSLRACASSLTALDLADCTFLRTIQLSTLTRLEVLDLSQCDLFPQTELAAALDANGAVLRNLTIDFCEQYTDDLLPHFSSLTRLSANDAHFDGDLCEELIPATCHFVNPWEPTESDSE